MAGTAGEVTPLSTSSPAPWRRRVRPSTCTSSCLGTGGRAHKGDPTIATMAARHGGLAPPWVPLCWHFHVVPLLGGGCECSPCRRSARTDRLRTCSAGSVTRDERPRTPSARCRSHEVRLRQLYILVYRLDISVTCARPRSRPVGCIRRRGPVIMCRPFERIALRCEVAGDVDDHVPPRPPTIRARLRRGWNGRRGRRSPLPSRRGGEA